MVKGQSMNRQKNIARVVREQRGVRREKIRRAYSQKRGKQ